MSNQEWVGQWWLPGREGERVGGELVLAADEFALKLSGTLVPPPTAPPPGGVISGFFRTAQEPFVLGESRSGEKITLLDCSGQVTEIPAHVRESEWRPVAGLVGGYIEKPEELTFAGVRAEFDYLPDWSESRLDYALEHQDRRMTRMTLDLEPTVVGSGTVGGTAIDLVIARPWTVGNQEAEVGTRPRFEVRLTEEVGWRDVMERWVRPLRDLVSFATIRGSRIETIDLHQAGGSDGWFRLLLWLTDLDRAPRTERRLIRPDMLFSAGQLPQGFQHGISRWFELHGTYSPVLLLMLGVDYAPFVYDEQRFLALAQAAEIYHRTAVGGSRLPTEEHRLRVDAVLAGLETDLTDWARPILQDSNWLRLAERLDDLTAQLGDLGAEISGGDPARFVRRIVDTRNYLTHRDERKSTVLEEAERYWHGQALAWLLRAYLLAELGFSTDEAAATLRQNSRYQFFVETMKQPT